MRKNYFLLFLVLCGPVSAASFDCAKASTSVEKQICLTPSLNAMDEVLAKAYKLNLEYTQDKTALKQKQRDWLKQRDSECRDNVYACETFLSERINELMLGANVSKNPETSVLAKGMVLPKPPVYTEYDQEVLDKYETSIFKPWIFKQISHDYNDDNLQKVMVVDGQIYAIYWANNKEMGKNQFHELNLLTMEDHIFASLNNKEFFLIAFSDKDQQVILNDKQAYKVGSQQALTDFTGDLSQLEYYSSEVETFSALSPDGRFYAIQTEFADEIRKNETDPVKQGYFAKLENLVVPSELYQENSILVYDSLNNTVIQLPNILTDDEGYAIWEVTEMRWSQDGQRLYFDNKNEGLACIWEWTIATNKVEKIVPDHAAVSPHPFTYQGERYVAYVIPAEFELEAGSLMLAKKPVSNK